MSNLKIRSRLIGAFAILVLTLGMISIAMYMAILDVRHAVKADVQAASRRTLIEQTLMSLVERQNMERGFLLAGDPSFVKRIEQAEGQLAHTVKSLAGSGVTENEAGQIARLRPMLDKLVADDRELMAMGADPATRADAQVNAMNMGRLTDVRSVMSEMRKEADDISLGSHLAQEESMGNFTRLLILAGLIAASLALAFAYLLNRSIGAPISKMADLMSALAKGQDRQEIPGLARRDEIGDMARAVQVFKQAVEDKLQLEQTEELRREAEELRQRGEADRAAAAARQSAVIGSLGDALSALEGADLTRRLQGLPPEFQKIERDYNAAMDRLEQVLAGVVESSQAIHSHSGEVAEVSSTMATRTERQSASLEEAAAALEQITATMKGMADGAQRATGVAGRAHDEVGASQQVLAASIAAIGRIADSSRRISSVIDVIDRIAFQTNLLALNAGVEAARAGNAGLGFAVVASEVRALAQRSASAALEIKTLIETSQDEVREGVQLIDRTGEAMLRISAHVSEVHQAVIEIANGAREQSTGIQEVNTAVSHMDQATQQNAAIVEEASSVSQRMYDEVRRLGDLIGVFRMSRRGRGAAAARFAA